MIALSHVSCLTPSNLLTYLFNLTFSVLVFLYLSETVRQKEEMSSIYRAFDVSQPMSHPAKSLRQPRQAKFRGFDVAGAWQTWNCPYSPAHPARPLAPRRDFHRQSKGELT